MSIAHIHSHTCSAVYEPLNVKRASDAETHLAEGTRALDRGHGLIASILSLHSPVGQYNYSVYQLTDQTKIIDTGHGRADDSSASLLSVLSHEVLW